MRTGLRRGKLSQIRRKSHGTGVPLFRQLLFLLKKVGLSRHDDKATTPFELVDKTGQLSFRQ